MGMKQEILKNKKFIQAGAWNVLGNILLKGSSLLFSLYFASVMSQSEFGEVSTFTSYASIFAVLVGLNLYSSLNNAKLEFANDYRGYQSSILTFSLLCFLPLTVLALVFMLPLSRLLRMGRADLILLLVYSVSMYVVTFYQTANTTRYRFKANVITSAFHVFAGFILSFLLVNVVMPDDKVTAKHLGATIPLFILAAYIVVNMLFKGRTLFRPVYWKYALCIAAPNMAHVLGQDILAQSDRIFIRHLCGAADVGVYSLIHYFGVGMTLLWSGINGVWVPWLFTRLATGDVRSIRRNSGRYLTIFSIITVLMCLAVPPFIKLLMPASYLEGVDIVFPIILSGYFMCLYSFMVNLEFYHKKNVYIAVGTAAAALLNILLNAIFIGTFGYHAAAYTTMFSYVALFAFHYVVADRVLKINIYRMHGFIVNIVCTCAACGLVSWLWSRAL